MTDAPRNENAYPLPKGTLYARLDQRYAIQDYAPDLPCLRLVGVSAGDFQARAFNEAQAEVFLLDIAWHDVCRSRPHGPLWEALRPSFRRYLEQDAGRDDEWDDEWDGNDTDAQAVVPWIKVRYRRARRPTGSYGYCLFQGVRTPTYLHIMSLQLVAGPAITPPPLLPLPVPAPAPAPVPAPPMATPLSVTAFHVGQGMCSLITHGQHGLLLDCGAGTPIKRPAYLAGPAPAGPFINDLHTAIQPLSTLEAIVSHADSDHWRLLDWDPALAAGVGRIIVPVGLAPLPFKSPALAGKVVAAGDHTVPLGTATLSVMRTAPSCPDTNGKALVARLSMDGQTLLFPGDYHYNRFASDGNPSINALVGIPCDAVVVPHHGSDGSKHAVPPAAVAGVSKAFFSAGNHSGYKHPRATSLAAHAGAGYAVISNNLLAHIAAQPLP